MTMTATAIAALRLVHILSGIVWMGGAVLTTCFIMPTARALGPGGGPLMHQLVQVRRLPVFMMVATLGTVLSGCALLWHNAGGGWIHSGPGMTFAVGGASAIVAAILGKVVIAPTSQRLGALAAAPAPSDERAAAARAAELLRLRTRMTRASWAGLALLTVAASAMSVARYV
jgi:hypothetical protein